MPSPARQSERPPRRALGGDQGPCRAVSLPGSVEPARPRLMEGRLVMPGVLVAYATKHGSTREVAEAVSKALRAEGVQVDLWPALPPPGAGAAAGS